MKYSRTFKIFGITIVLFLLMSAIPAVPAYAQTYTYDIELNPEEGTIGDEINITGENFIPSSETTERWVRIIFSNEEADTGDFIDYHVNNYEVVETEQIGYFDDPDEGEFETTFEVPEVLDDGDDSVDVSPGTYNIYVTMITTVDPGTVIRAAAEFTVINSHGDTTVSIKTPEDVPEDADFTATVDINYVENLNSGQYDIWFDSEVLRLDEVTAGLIDSTAVSVMSNELESGHWRVINSMWLGSVTGSGYLARLNFHSLGVTGTFSDINITDGILSDTSGDNITAIWLGDSVEVSLFIPGDANGDGIINVFDMTKAARIILELDDPTPGADADQNGSIDIFDMTKIARIILELD